MQNSFNKIAVCEIEWDTKRIKLPDQIIVRLDELGLTCKDLQSTDMETAQNINIAIETYLYSKYGHHTHGFGWEER